MKLVTIGRYPAVTVGLPTLLALFPLRSDSVFLLELVA